MSSVFSCMFGIVQGACLLDEEMFGGLCYKKCHGESFAQPLSLPICPCFLFSDLRRSLHPLIFSICMQLPRCSLFPDGQIYGHRVAPNICCSTHGLLGRTWPPSRSTVPSGRRNSRLRGWIRLASEFDEKKVSNHQTEVS